MKICEFCKKPLLRRQKKFCDKRCSAKYLNEKRFGKRIKIFCIRCKKDLVGDPRSNFCSRSCSASYNNTKRKKYADHLGICSCGNLKDKKSIKCHRCKIEETLIRNNRLQLKDAISKGNSRIKYSRVRQLASETMKFHKIKKECCYCGFNITVQVCHLKKISSFLLTDLVGDINSINNLRYLCPNHHVMLDKNLLEINEIKSRPNIKIDEILVNKS